MECIRCNGVNPQGKRYCGDCGAPLDPNAGPLMELIELSLNQRIQSILKEQLKDKQLVELEITESIVSRLSNWTKLLGFFVGIPLLLLAFLLGFFGIQTYSDFSKIVKATQKNISDQLQHAQKQADLLKEQSDRLLTEYNNLRTQLVDASVVAQEVKTLAKKVEQIEEKIAFEPSTALPAELKAKIESSLYSFQNYFTELGFKPIKGSLTVKIDPNLENNAYYIPGENQIVIGASVAGDKDMALWTYASHVLSALRTKLVKTDESSDPTYLALSTGLSDYFTCSFNNDPLLSKQSRHSLRNLENQSKFSNLPTLAGQNQWFKEAAAWGGALWEIRKLLGKNVADRLVFTTWTVPQSLRGGSKIATNFVERLLKIAQSSNTKQDVDKIRLVFERRGLQL
jgi:hypothetical protein